MDIVGACLLDGFPTDNKLSLKTSKSAAKGGNDVILQRDHVITFIIRPVPQPIVRSRHRC